MAVGLGGRRQLKSRLASKCIQISFDESQLPDYLYSQDLSSGQTLAFFLNFNI